MHCAGLGKAILAFLPQAQQEQILGSRPLRTYTPYTITDPMLLRVELDRTRERGYAIDRDEIIMGVHCVAVPILNYAGHAIGAISIAGTTPKIERRTPRSARAADYGRRRVPQPAARVHADEGRGEYVDELVMPLTRNTCSGN
jgi:DNA-binding IclR family transcriptional regulator